MTSPAPQPIPVHVASAGTGVKLGGCGKRRIVTIYKTLVLTASNPWDQLVPENPDRHSWQLTGAQGAATAAANDLLIGSNQGDIRQAAATAEGLNAPGLFVPAGSLAQAQRFEGMNPVWIAVLGASPTYPMYISVADHVYTDG